MVDSACANCPGFLVPLLLAPGSRASSGSVRLRPRASILHGPFEQFLDLLPLAPRPPVQKPRTNSTSFCNTKDTPKKKLEASQSCSRRRTNVQQLTCNIDLSCSFYYFFFSFVLIELKRFVLKGKVLGEKFWKSVKKCEKMWKFWNNFCH